MHINNIRGVLNMMLIKMFLLISIFVCSLYIGILISKKYSNREKELIELQNALNMLEAKIKFTYEPLADLFLDISESIKNNIGQIFEKAQHKMNIIGVGQAWNNAVEDTNTDLTEEDKNILKGLGRLIGKTDIEGQISEIELLKNFIVKQTEKAKIEREKNEKIYKTLGGIAGMAIVIILM